MQSILKRIIFSSIFLFSFCNFASAQNEFSGLPPIVNFESDGWKEVVLPNDLAIISERRARAFSASALAEAEKETRLIQIYSTAGINNSPLPSSIKAELSDTTFNSGEVIYVDKRVAEAIDNGTASDIYSDYIEPDDGAAGKMAAPLHFGCSHRWRGKSFSKTLEMPSASQTQSIPGGSISIEGHLVGAVNAGVNISYKKSSFCIPYAVRYESASANGSISMDGSKISMVGALERSVSDYSSITLFSKTWYFQVGPIPVIVHFKIPLEYGYSAKVRTAATVELNTGISGSFSFNYVCGADGCTGSKDTSALRFNGAIPTPNAALTVDATFDPSVTLNFQGVLYAKDFTWASIGLKFSTPIKYFAYTGNTCGDANNDQINENVSTQFVDAAARVSLVGRWSFFGNEKQKYFDVGGKVGEGINGALYDVLHEEGMHKPLYYKNLYFKEIGQGNMFQPIVQTYLIGSVIAPVPGGPRAKIYNGGIQFSMRPCLPFNGEFLADVDINGIRKNITINSESGKAGYTESKASPSFLSVEYRYHIYSLTDSANRIFDIKPN